MEQNIWESVKERILLKNPENQKLKEWVSSVSLVAVEPINETTARVRLSVPSEIHKWWINTNIINEICTEIRDLFGHPFEVEIAVSDAVPIRNSSLFERIAGTVNIVDPKVSPAQQFEYQSVVKAQPTQNAVFKPEYSFKTFVVGKNNEFAHAACYAVADNPGTTNNPLYIYGPSGMGKTHLLNAVGNHIREKFPHLRMRYITAENFINQFTGSLRHQEMDKFRKRFREDTDVFLVDDVQFLKGEATQEEFFHTLNALFQVGRQVVFSSDRMPSEIQGLEDRVRTRLEWGLTADIQMPDIETRMAILKYKAESQNIHLPDEVVEFIARISKRSIRELEGNLKKVEMYTSLQGLPISLDWTKKILSNHTAESGHLTMEEIQKIVAQTFDVRIPDLKSQNRSKPIVTARQMAMYLCKKFLDKPLADIGRAFGGKDHTTVINAIRRIEEFLEKDPEIRQTYNELQTKIHSITGV